MNNHAILISLFLLLAAKLSFASSISTPQSKAIGAFTVIASFNAKSGILPVNSELSSIDANLAKNNPEIYRRSGQKFLNNLPVIFSISPLEIKDRIYVGYSEEINFPTRAPGLAEETTQGRFMFYWEGGGFRSGFFRKDSFDYILRTAPSGYEKNESEFQFRALRELIALSKTTEAITPDTSKFPIERIVPPANQSEPVIEKSNDSSTSKPPASTLLSRWPWVIIVIIIAIGFAIFALKRTAP